MSFSLRIYMRDNVCVTVDYPTQEDLELAFLEIQKELRGKGKTITIVGKNSTIYRIEHIQAVQANINE